MASLKKQAISVFLMKEVLYLHSFTVVVVKGDKFNNKKHPGHVNSVFKDLGIDIRGVRNHNTALVYDVRSKYNLCDASRRMVLNFMIKTASPCEDVYIFGRDEE